ncbi:hypothetical protein C8J57DRAFT_433892 [Mycena rebaudengoi]|nr:hypothetical protein C8J57DRAFT_433892 [Mycena rebaudengoi]
MRTSQMQMALLREALTLSPPTIRLLALVLWPLWEVLLYQLPQTLRNDLGSSLSSIYLNSAGSFRKVWVTETGVRGPGYAAALEVGEGCLSVIHYPFGQLRYPRRSTHLLRTLIQDPL